MHCIKRVEFIPNGIFITDFEKMAEKKAGKMLKARSLRNK